MSGIGKLLLIYGLLNLIGGIVGFVKAKSKASLIAGGLSGAILILCTVLIVNGISAAAYVGFVDTLLLAVVFAMRYVKTKKVMPAGMMLGISILFAVLIAYQLFAS